MEIRFLQAGCGDAIHIRFKGDDGEYHNILVDGGVEREDIYLHGLQQALLNIHSNNEVIDLWIISHIDDDHIGGLLRFIKDNSLFKKFDLSKTQFWYNDWHSDYPINIIPSKKKSLKQGIRLREFLKTKSHVKSSITDQCEPQNIFGAKLTLLSPSAEKLKSLLERWKLNEIKLINKIPSKKKINPTNDYGKPIESFDTSAFTQDRSEENGSSIAFLLTFNDKTALFSADSHPSVVCSLLHKLGFSEANKLKLAFLQLSHHGSKFNTNEELIKLIACDKYVISANGYNKANLPNKETLARVLKNSMNANNNFYITHRNQWTSGIFKVDKLLKNVEVFFPQGKLTYLQFIL